MEVVLKLFVCQDIGCKLNLFDKNPKITLANVTRGGFGLHKASAQDELHVLNVKLYLRSLVSNWRHETRQFAVLLPIVRVWEQVAGHFGRGDIGEGRFYILRE